MRSIGETGLYMDKPGFHIKKAFERPDFCDRAHEAIYGIPFFFL
jgi:hypothetical protein